MRRVFLVDCPGVVYHHNEDNNGDAVRRRARLVHLLICSSVKSQWAWIQHTLLPFGVLPYAHRC
jgi:ribosome biogenesis GTPase A